MPNNAQARISVSFTITDPDGNVVGEHTVDSEDITLTEEQAQALRAAAQNEDSINGPGKLSGSENRPSDIH